MGTIPEAEELVGFIVDPGTEVTPPVIPNWGPPTRGIAHDIRTTKPSEEAAKKQMNVSSVRASRKDPIRPESCFRDMEGRFI